MLTMHLFDQKYSKKKTILLDFEITDFYVNVKM